MRWWWQPSALHLLVPRWASISHFQFQNQTFPLFLRRLDLVGHVVPSWQPVKVGRWQNSHGENCTHCTDCALHFSGVQSSVSEKVEGTTIKTCPCMHPLLFWHWITFPTLQPFGVSLYRGVSRNMTHTSWKCLAQFQLLAGSNAKRLFIIGRVVLIFLFILFLYSYENPFCRLGLFSSSLLFSCFSLTSTHL